MTVLQVADLGFGYGARRLFQGVTFSLEPAQRAALVAPNGAGKSTLLRLIARELPPDETRSGRGTLANFVKIDDYTLQMWFDAPAPLTADRMAMWVKRDPFVPGRWMDPKHYLSQFHIKYNASLNPATWTEEYLRRREHRLNMWFVLATERPGRIAALVAEIARRTGLEVLNLPKLEEYFLELKLRA